MHRTFRTFAAVLAALWAQAGSAQDAGTALAYANFTAPGATQQGGTVNTTVYSEKPADASVGPLSVADGVLTVTGEFNPVKASQWAGVGFNVDSPDKASANGSRNLQDYTQVRVRLASGTAKALRLRLVGTDAAVQGAGCYPVVSQSVTPTLTEYTIPLRRFAAEAYCGGKGRSAAQTLPQVTAFEVVDAAQPVSARGVSFQVGAVEFLR